MWPLKFLLCFLFWEASCQCAEDCDSPALLSVAKHGGSFHNARLLRCAWAPPGDAACFDTEPPPTFTVKFVLRDGRSFKVKTYRDWAPPFAQRFWQLSKLNWWKRVAIYRNDYRNESTRFVSQWGLVGDPKVNNAWTKWKTSNATAPALETNTRGRVAFAMDAVTCQAGPDDPCQPLRPNCTAADYCALGFSTEIFVNYGNNSRLDAHGFAPIGEVDDEGMEVLDALGSTLGNLYGEVQDLCPPTPPASEPYCVYRDGEPAGVNETLFQTWGNPYIRKDFPVMFRLRIASAFVESDRPYGTYGRYHAYTGASEN